LNHKFATWKNKLIDICRSDLMIANEKMNRAIKIKISKQMEILLKEFEALHRKLSKYLTTELKIET
jgi:ribosome maturation factor RimP